MTRGYAAIMISQLSCRLFRDYPARAGPSYLALNQAVTLAMALFAVVIGTTLASTNAYVAFLFCLIRRFHAPVQENL